MNTIHVFLTGITGVFLGMAVLYFSIKITSAILNNFFNVKSGK